MPYSDPEVRRAYSREWVKKRRADPEFRAKTNKQYMERLRERLKDPEFRKARNAKHRAEHATNRNSQIAQQKRRYATLKAAFERWRDNLRCIRCGSAEYIEFHHRDKTTKLANVGSLFHCPELFNAELAKCDILCRKCHKSHHKHERRHKSR